MNTILMIDDDKELCSLIKKCLDNEEMSTLVAFSGSLGLKVFGENKDNLSLIILDVMLPDLDGFSILKRVREISNVPVLMLTAKNSEEDKIIGLRTGADDYLTKPFEAPELLARVKSLLRRPNVFVSSVMTVGNIELNRDKFTMQSASGQVLLNNKEFQLMEYFMMNSNQVLSTELIMEKVWGLDSDAEINVVWVNISSLRKKLASIEANVTIKSARGLGYQLMVEA